MTGDETTPYLADPRPCGQCGHTTSEHWTETTGSFGCTRPGCDCAGWFAVTAEHLDGLDGCGLDGSDGRSRADRPGWVGPAVVTLCGSMRFWPLMLTVAATETAAGTIVLAPFVTIPTDAQNAVLGGGPVGLKVQLDALHRAKIAMSSAVLVVTDHTGYWGTSTRAEIDYAQALGLPVRVCEVDRVTGAQITHAPLTGSWGWSR